MPALVKSSVGSSPGTSELEGTIMWLCARKNSRNALRTSAALMYEGLLKVLKSSSGVGSGQWPRGYDPMKRRDSPKGAPAAPGGAGGARRRKDERAVQQAE